MTDVSGENGRAQTVTCKVKDGSEKVFEADAVVFAVGIKAMQKIVQTSPLLAQHQSFRNVRFRNIPPCYQLFVFLNVFCCCDTVDYEFEGHRLYRYSALVRSHCRCQESCQRTIAIR